MTVDRTLQERIEAARANRDSSLVTPMKAGGEGVDDPSMAKRVEALEAELKDARSTLKELEAAGIRIESRLLATATNADVATLVGAVSLVSQRLQDQTRRLAALEDTLRTTVATALRKTIGVAGTIVLFVVLGTVLGLAAAALKYYNVV